MHETAEHVVVDWEWQRLEEGTRSLIYQNPFILSVS